MRNRRRQASLIVALVGAVWLCAPASATEALMAELPEVVDPFRWRPSAGDHAPTLAYELLGRGHHVRGFGGRPDSGEPKTAGRVVDGVVGNDHA